MNKSTLIEHIQSQAGITKAQATKALQAFESGITHALSHGEEVALVGFGRIARRPMEDDGQLTLQPSVVASLAADHRVSDGHRGALFLLELRELLQHPEEL